MMYIFFETRPGPDLA